jgi:hypothetical protein
MGQLLNKIRQLILLLSLVFLFSANDQESTLFVVQKGSIHFLSEAPLELIEAKSSNLKGILSSDDKTFAFSVKVKSFEGFNSALQKEHFLENYMENEKYASATFTGTIIEDVDLFTEGLIVARAKGKFKIHGEENIQLIDVLLNVRENKIEIESKFEILLEDYSIDIPRIVNKKIAETIHITVNATLEKK